MGLRERLVSVLIVHRRLRRKTVLTLLLRRRYAFHNALLYLVLTLLLRRSPQITPCSYSSRSPDLVCPTPTSGFHWASLSLGFLPPQKNRSLSMGLEIYVHNIQILRNLQSHTKLRVYGHQWALALFSHGLYSSSL